MRISLHSALLLIAATAAASAQTPAAPGGMAADTARADSGCVSRPVVVEAESMQRYAAGSARPMAVIGRSEIEAIGAVDLSDIVALSPGVFVRQYGGLGGLRTVSLRGTSAQQAIVMIDGVRYQSTASGGVDLGLLPADAIERVEVIRGGDAALYGANALGGVINVVTRRGTGAGLHAELHTGLGSFAEREIGGLVSGGGGGHLWSANGSLTSSSGEYPFEFNEFGATSTIRRENADFRNLHGGGSWSYRADDGWRFAASGQGFAAGRGAPGAVVQGNREELRARLDERELFGTATASYAGGGWSVLSALSARANVLRYSDPDERTFGPAGVETEFDRREAGLTLRGRRAVSDVAVIEASADVAAMRLTGDNLDPAVADGVDRVQIGGALLTSWSLAGLPLASSATLEAGLRGDHIGGVGSALGPSLGLVLVPGSGPVSIRAHYARNYRVPTFVEQYYLNYGNIDLRPERSTSVDAGLAWHVADLLLEADGFLIDTRDAILSVPRSPVSWSAMNVGRTLSRGVELSAGGRLLDGLLEMRASYTRMRAEDRSGGSTDGKLLPYAPEELATGYLRLHVDRVAVGPTWEYASHRYSLASNGYDALLPHYVILGATASASWTLGALDLTARMEAANLFDTRYQVIRNYPMPGRSLRVGVDLRYTAP